MASKVFSLEEFNLADRLGLYAAFNNEIQTDGIFSKSHALRKEIFYPAVNPKTKEIHFYRVHALKDLKAGFSGILEPDKSRYPLTNLNLLNVIIIPGVAFDKKGNRIGFGEGYYDRLLEKFKGKKIALAYDFQVVETLPSTARDQRVDMIVTEERIIKVD